MLSRRTAVDPTPNALARLLDARRAAGSPVLDLTASNPTRSALAYPGDAIRAALAGPGTLEYAPDPRGLLCARQAVSRYYAARGAEVDPARLVLTASTSEAYAFLFTLLADPGEAVLAPAPSYPLLEHLAALASLRLVPYPLAFDGDCWRLDLESLAEAAAREARARLVVVVSPNNPTGNFLTRAEAAALADLCADRGLALVTDEVFADYACAEDPARAPTVAGGLVGSARRAPLAFALSGLSKVAGLPQLKLAWLAASGPGPLLDPALARLDVVADAFLSVATPVQVALPALLGLAPTIREAILARVRANRAVLERRVGPSSPCRVLPSEGGWYAVLRVPRGAGEEPLVLALLEQDGVLIHPGYFFDFPAEGFLVASLLPPPEQFEEGIGRVLRRIEREG